MNITVTFTVDGCNEFQASSLLTSISSMMGGAKLANAEASVVVETIEGTTAKAASQATEPAESTVEDAKAKKAAAAKARRAKKKADAEQAEVDLIGKPDKQVTLDELKAAVRECVDAQGVDAVKAIFEEHGAEKLSGISEADYADVLAALNERS